MDCDQIYKTVVEGAGGYNYILFDLAECFLSGYDKEKLRAMLRSNDLGVVTDGIFVASEIGGLAREYIDDLSLLASSSDELISRLARELLAVYAPDRAL